MGTDAYTNDMLESLKVALCSQRSQNCLPNVGWCEVTDMLFQNNAKIGEKYFPATLGVLKAGARRTSSSWTISPSPPSPTRTSTAT